LSALQVEGAGFDAVWLSSRELSALNGLPSGECLSLVEISDAARRVRRSVAAPVLVDYGGGFGNAVCLMRAVEEFEQEGLAGFCFGEVVHPRRHSFPVGVRQELVPHEEQAGRIRAACDARQKPDFMILAAVEAPSPEDGPTDVLARCRAYAAAGADALLLRTGASANEEIERISLLWEKTCPLLVERTLGGPVPVDALAGVGLQGVVFSTQTIRSSIKAIGETLATLKGGVSPVAAEARCATAQEMDQLLKADALRQRERRYLPSAAERDRAIIVAAGFEQEMLPLIEDRPKNMLDIKGKSILERQIEVLGSCGVKDVVVVRGYKKDKISVPGIRYYDNDAYAESHILESLLTARGELQGRFVFLYGDILFDQSVVERLLQSGADVSLAVDSALKKNGRRDQKGLREFVIVEERTSGNGAGINQKDHSTLIRKIGRRLLASEADGAFIGMAMFSKAGARRLVEAYDAAHREGAERPFQEAPSLRKAGFTDVVQELIDRGEQVAAVEIGRTWMHIDSFGDYQRAWAAMA
jgi:phosphoenolpyruvate phosphomutase